jgi:hypothetical protein
MAPVGQKTLTEIVQAAADLADQPTPSSTTYISLTRWYQWANAAMQELYDELIEAYGEDYFFQQTPHSITTDGTNSKYALPDDFYKLLGVELSLNGPWVTIWRYNFASRNVYALPNLAAAARGTALKYRLQGYYINFIPSPPASGQSLRLWYSPRFTPLTAGGDNFDGINGWEEYVIATLALKALGKEESDQSPATGLLARQMKRLESIKAARDVGAPSTTVDVYAVNGAQWPEGWL